MADYKEKFVSEVSEALVGQISQSDIGIVSDEMTIATLTYVYSSEEKIRTSYLKYSA